MAERGAHLTQTLLIRPSIFDFVAHETLNDLLYPSAKKIVDVLALRSSTFMSISKWFDEYFLISHCLLQLYYLKKFGAAFSEKFYGLQRVPLKGLRNGLGTKELVLSLFAVSVFPYLRAKLNDVAEKMLFDGLPRTTQKEKIRLMKSIIYCNNGLNISYQLIKFVQHLKYLSNKTDINSPLLWVAGVKLKYSEQSAPDDVSTLRNFIPQLLQRSLEISTFFMQFFQWWQVEKGGSLNSLPAPPPPQKTEDGLRYRDKCPICLKKRNIETVLSTSGFVFCFKCITAHLMENNCCPVTKLPATLNNLIRIYPFS